MLKLRKKFNNKSTKTRKTKAIAGSMDSINADYKRFCDRHIHHPLFDCCCQVITNNTECNGDRDQEHSQCTNEILDNFSNLSINESVETGSSSNVENSKKKKRRKSAEVSGTSSASRSTRRSAKKFFSTSDLTIDLPKGFKGAHHMKRPLEVHVKNMNLNHKYVKLKNNMQALSSSIPDLSLKKFSQISDHDKKILSRMVMKRRKEIAMMEDAKLARQYWEKEKEGRQKFIQEQNESYFKTIKEKRQQEQVETKKRIEQLQMEEQQHIERLKQELAEKEAKTESLLKTLEFRKEMKVYQKRQRELQKMDMTLVNQQENEVNDAIWRQILIERLQQRIHRAENLRQKVMEVYKSRITSDNQLEQTIHAVNYDETKKMEEFKMAQLRQKIHHRDEKYKQFAEHRSQLIKESQQKAKISAAMRELIKRSISPESTTFVTGTRKPTHERPISILSHCDSHIVLG